MTLSPTHSDYAALLAACAYDPDEDTPRLVLADWLEENDDLVRGEFIRVQVELARHLDEPAKDWEHLVAREDALLAEHEARWRRGPECERCGGNPNQTRFRGPGATNPFFWGCPACHGTGWSRWWLAERRIVDHPDGPRSTTTWRHRVHFERGLIVQVDANLSDIFQDDSPTPWALAVVRSEPLLRQFGVVDRPAWERDGWWTCLGNEFVDRPDLGSPLADAVYKTGHYGWFDSPTAANRALAESAWTVVERAVRARLPVASR